MSPSRYNGKIVILVLAAGASKRMGTCKLLLKVEHETLITRLINEIETIPNSSTFLITGAYHEDLKKELHGRHVDIQCNQEWQMGMGKSIAVGVQNILEKEDPRYIIVCVADQYFLKASVLQEMIKKQLEHPTSIILSKYAKASGPPSSFPKQYFEELLRLKDDQGAKQIVQKNQSHVQFIDFPNGCYDIDTLEDLRFAIELERSNKNEPS